jgi:tetratricopeptide (TPR) repeat protein
MRKIIISTISLMLVLTIISYALLLNPVIQEKAGWHLNAWAIRLRTWLKPPEVVSFGDVEIPDGKELPLPDATIETPSPLDSVPEEPTASDPSFPPPPSSFSIDGGTYFSQHNRWNYCGPASIATLLSYWEWDGDHDAAAKELRTYSMDKNIMPYEMVNFAREEGYGALERVGGDLEVLKRLISNGFPVIIEKGTHFRDIHFQITWMGHYQVLTGYDDASGYFIAQDPYIDPDFHQPYEILLEEWRSFNYTYMIVFPEGEENEVLNLLGADAVTFHNYERALQKAQAELYDVSGVDLFFAMFNYGTNLVHLRDYTGAAKAYDQAFMIYDTLPQDLNIRPYRILWYQTEPFFAYYYTGRYADVVIKATKNSIEMVRDDLPALEESYYWRGVSKIALGDKDGGIKDLLQCLEYHRDFNPCVEALNQQGIYP